MASSLEKLLGHAEGADAIADYKATIIDAIRSQPRSLQKLIGPSEIGTSCDHCLAAKLAGWQEQERDVPWLPFIGTAVHAELAGIFEAANETSLKAGGRRRYRVEERVYVGHIGDHAITGTCDLYDTFTGTVLDHKIVGAATLGTAKGGVKPVYRIQAHLYGRGWEHAGHTPKRVVVAHLPRNAPSFDQAVIWTEDYQPEIAEQALARASSFHDNLTLLHAISVEARDSWITGLDREPGCYSCPRYPDWATQPSALTTEFGLDTTSGKQAAA